jgi:hypothetical protein
MVAFVLFSEQTIRFTRFLMFLSLFTPMDDALCSVLRTSHRGGRFCKKVLWGLADLTFACIFGGAGRFLWVSSRYGWWQEITLGISPVGHQNFIPRFLGVNKNEFRHPVRSLDT